MKNSVILIYLVFTVFVSLNNFIVTERSIQKDSQIQNLTDKSSQLDFTIILPNGISNHKLNHSGNIKSVIAYLNDIMNISKLIVYPASETYPYKHMILSINNNFYHMDEFLPITTQSDKTIQAEFLII